MKLVAALLIAPVVLAAAPAPEQARPDHLSKASLARVELAKFARCTIDRAPREVARVLDMPEGPESRTATTILAGNSCHSARDAVFGEKEFRGALFVELYKRRVAAGGATPTLAGFDADAVMTEGDAETQRFNGLLWFADCVVKRDAAAARDVVLSAIGSEAQVGAYQRLTPHLGPCLVEGAQVRFTRGVLEGALAEVLYRTPA
jgi:hypothetical protein